MSSASACASVTTIEQEPNTKTKKQNIKKTKSITGEDSVASALNSIVKKQFTNMAEQYNIYASAISEMEEKIKMLKNIMLSDTFLKNCKNMSLDTCNISNKKLKVPKESKVHINNSNENIILHSVVDKNTNNQENNEKDNEKYNKENIQQNKYFTPSQKDTLFWCFYIIYNGYQSYEYETNYFTAEQQFKIQTIERIKKGENKNLLKENKISKNFLEGGLMTNITPKVLYALCIFYNINIFYVHKNTYYEMFTNIDKPTYIIKYNSDTNNYSIALPVKMNVNDTEIIPEHQNYIEKIKLSLLKLDNIDKPLRAITTYSVGDLVKICEKLDISILNDLNKKKTKAELYANILQKL
jgi:hypothetical protein